eukprot:32085-Eustigmatos_ZCMA.PRE.1
MHETRGLGDTAVSHRNRRVYGLLMTLDHCSAWFNAAPVILDNSWLRALPAPPEPDMGRVAAVDVE